MSRVITHEAIEVPVDLNHDVRASCQDVFGFTAGKVEARVHLD